MHPSLTVAQRGSDHVRHEAAGIGHHESPRFRDHFDIRLELRKLLADQRPDRLDRGRRLGQLDRIAAAQVEQTRAQSRTAQPFEHRARASSRRTPVLRVAALAADMEGHPGDIQLQPDGFLDDRIDVGFAGAELAAQRPVRALVARLDPQVQLGVGLQCGELAELLHAVDGVPLDLGRRHADRTHQVQLGRGCDLESDALLRQRLQHAPVGIGLDRVVRAHGRHCRGKAPGVVAHSRHIDHQRRPAVTEAGQRLLDAGERHPAARVGLAGCGRPLRRRRRLEHFERLNGSPRSGQFVIVNVGRHYAAPAPVRDVPAVVRFRPAPRRTSRTTAPDPRSGRATIPWP